MNKFEVRVGTEFKSEETIKGRSRPNYVTIIINGKDPEKPSRWLLPFIVVAGFVGLLLTLGAASALAYGMKTGDYTLLKKFPDLIQGLLSAVIALLSKKP
jgi:hypothetical protein